MSWSVLHKGGKSEAARQLQAAMNRRLKARDLSDYVVPEDGIIGNKTLLSARKAAWALGARKSTYDHITKSGEISVGVQRMIRNPGLRSGDQISEGAIRVATMQAARKKAAADAASVTGHRESIRRFAEQAAANYRRDPFAYHYLAGGIANLIFLAPSPRTYRSDCSQFGAAIYHAAGLPSPGGKVAHAFTSTYSMATAGTYTEHPHMGDLGMYGSRWAPHHVEVYLVTHFIGHGTAPIDSRTPGYPDFFLTFPFLQEAA